MKTKNELELITVTTIDPIDLTAAEARALHAKGYRIPLSARIGRGPLASFKGAKVS